MRVTTQLKYFDNFQSQLATLMQLSRQKLKETGMLPRSVWALCAGQRSSSASRIDLDLLQR